MKISQLKLEELRDMFIYVSKKMIESKSLLTQADKAVGDGDHGVNMARGFETVRQKLEGHSFTTIKELVNTIGTTLMVSVGGASGAIFGTFFTGAAKDLKEEQHNFNMNTFSQMLFNGLKAVKQRGKANPGDKTMVDALEPATLKAREMTSFPLSRALIDVTEEARKGVEKTKNMIAKVGKAKSLGKRTIGYPDPGAISTYLILKYMMEFISQKIPN